MLVYTYFVGPVLPSYRLMDVVSSAGFNLIVFMPGCQVNFRTTSLYWNWPDLFDMLGKQLVVPNFWEIRAQRFRRVVFLSPNWPSRIASCKKCFWPNLITFWKFWKLSFSQGTLGADARCYLGRLHLHFWLQVFCIFDFIAFPSPPHHHIASHQESAYNCGRIQKW